MTVGKKLSKPYIYVICAVTSMLIFVTACNNEKKRITETVSQLLDKEIVFPDDFQSKILGKDTAVDVLGKKGYKIVTFADSIGCTDCRLNFYGWKLKIKEAQEWSKPVDFVFIVQPRSEYELYNVLKFDQINFPVFYDFNASFIRKNQLPTGARYQTFLLNDENRIVLVGNPISNKVLWGMYKETVESQP
jgi:hypothetical protein